MIGSGTKKTHPKTSKTDQHQANFNEIAKKLFLMISQYRINQGSHIYNDGFRFVSDPQKPIKQAQGKTDTTPPNKSSILVRICVPARCGQRGGSASLTLTRLRVDASRSCGSKGGASETITKNWILAVFGRVGGNGRGNPRPRNSKAIDLENRCQLGHPCGTLTGRLRDRYG